MDRHGDYVANDADDESPGVGTNHTEDASKEEGETSNWNTAYFDAIEPTRSTSMIVLMIDASEAASS